MTAKTFALVDGLGQLVRFELMQGQQGEITGAAALIKGLRSGSPKAMPNKLQSGHMARRIWKAFHAQVLGSH